MANQFPSGFVAVRRHVPWDFSGCIAVGDNYRRTIPTVHLELPAELLALAGSADMQPSRAAAQLIALELFREDRVSLGKAAELAGMALEDFMGFSAQRAVPLRYTRSDWESDHAAAGDLARCR